ncbi:MAG: hypothetical protein ACRDYZ_10055 [Acidimicrobiales bacterium]
MKLSLTDVQVDQTLRFYRQGSVLGGTIKSGSMGIDVAVDIASDEPKERIAELIRVARASCFTHGSMAEPVMIETSARLNGKPLKVRAES